MAEMTGTVTCLAVSEHAAFTTIKNASGTVEAFSLWFSGSGGEPTPSELEARVANSMWVSMLAAAHSNGLKITVVHPDNSSQITSLRLGPLPL
jgi:hypothetical protein